MHKLRGSAILVAILLVTAVGVVGLSFGRILYLQVTTSSKYESGISAYYAAESGLEEGFLRYRYDRNSQLPATLSDKDWISKTNDYVRKNVSSRLVIKEDLQRATTLTSNADQIYDLRIGSKVKDVSSNIETDGLTAVDTNPKNTDFATSGSPYYIERDTTKKIDLADALNGEDIDLYFKSYKTTDTGLSVFNDEKCVLIEAKIVGESGGEVKELKRLLKNSACTYPTTSFTLEAGTTSDYSYTADSAVVTSLKAAMNYSAYNFSSATLYLKPIGADIAYKLSLHNSSNSVHLASAMTTVTATGYYGGVARTLQSKIAYQNGSLFDLYDYVIFDGTN